MAERIRWRRRDIVGATEYRRDNGISKPTSRTLVKSTRLWVGQPNARDVSEESSESGGAPTSDGAPASRGADGKSAGEAAAETSSGTDRSPATEGGLFAALHVKRNVAIAAVVGVVISGLVYAGRIMEVLGPAPSRGSPTLFFGLAIVLASAIAGLVAFVLIAGSAIRLARSTAAEETDRPRER